MNTISKNASLLVVDSNEPERDILARDLELSGFNVFKTTTLGEATQLADKYQPDLVIIDSETDDLSAANITSSTFITSMIPFLFLASANSTGNNPSPFEQRAVGYIVKPIRISQLIAAIETAITRAREIRNLIQQQGNLKEALKQNREISIAIGILMAHTDYTYKQAEDILRTYARNSRQKMSDISTRIINAAESFNALLHKITKNSTHKVN